MTRGRRKKIVEDRQKLAEKLKEDRKSILELKNFPKDLKIFKNIKNLYKVFSTHLNI